MSEKKTVRADMFGRVIKLGDFMVYPSTLGRSGTLMVVQVVEFVGPTSEYGDASSEVRMRARGMSQCYGGPKAKSKLSLINFPERGMVVPRDALPDQCIELIRSVPEKEAAR